MNYVTALNPTLESHKKKEWRNVGAMKKVDNGARQGNKYELMQTWPNASIRTVIADPCRREETVCFYGN